MKNILLILVAGLLALVSCTNFPEEDEKLLEIVGETTVLFKPEGGTSSLTLRSGTKWELTEKPDWIKVASVNAGSNPYEWTVNLKCEENEGSYRTGLVYFKTAFSKTKCDVSQSAAPVVHVQSVSLDYSTLKLNLNDSYKLTATVLPDNASNKEVTWTSSNPDVVSVEKGVVKALSAGDPVKITVSSVDGNKRATCDVTVLVPVSSIEMPKELSLVEEDSKTLSYRVLPPTASDPSLTWESSDPTVATVDNGTVTAIAAGTTRVTATSKSNPSVSAYCDVTVTPKHINVSSVRVPVSTMNLTAGESRSLSLIVEPDNATDKRVKWSDKVQGVAKLDENADGTFTVHALMKGTTVFTFTSVDNPEAKAELTVNVTINYTEPELVDLGLPSKIQWAKWNLGASKESDPGFYYAWGETEPKLEYTWPKYTLASGTSTSLNKYNTDSSYGKKDDEKELLASDDAATKNLGGKWRIPTSAEIEELITKCTANWSSVDGVSGYKFTGPNGKSIFIPVEGFRDESSYVNTDIAGYYWSSTLWTEKPYQSVCLSFESSKKATTSSKDRRYGLSIRPVYGDKKVEVTEIKVDPTTLDLKVDKTGDVKVTVGPSNATDKSFTWEVDDPGIASVIKNSNGTVTVTGLIPGMTNIKFSSVSNDKVTANLKVSVTKVYSVPTPIDLGLPSGVKWASFNLGATTSTGYGDLFAWGEIAPKSKYTWTNYLWRSSGDSNSTVKFSKYDNNTKELDVDDDAARKLLKGEWRIPTKDDFDELKANCNFDWNSQGYWTVTNKKNSSAKIYLPAAGCSWDNKTADQKGIRGMFWLNTLADSDSRNAQQFTLSAGSSEASSSYRYYGLSIRPVYGTPKIRVQSVTVDPKTLNLSEGESATLTAVITPPDATDKSCTWDSENSDIASVDSKTGKVTANFAGTTRIVATTTDGSKKGYCTVTVEHAFRAIDLGLPSGTKWANMNLGARTPYEYGDCYAWGETDTKKEYYWGTYKWGREKQLVKYNHNSDYGEVDNKLTLDLEDDVANKELKEKGNWYIPTPENYAELGTYCTEQEWVTIDNTICLKLTSSINRNFIIFPLTGYFENTGRVNQNSIGTYWTSSLSEKDSRYAYNFFISTTGPQFVDDSRVRCSGRSVRAVLVSGSLDVPVTDLTLNKTSFSLEEGREYQLTATITPDNARDKYISWTSSDRSVATVDGTGLVKGLKPGEATITAATRDGKFKKTCSVTVTYGYMSYIGKWKASGRYPNQANDPWTIAQFIKDQQGNPYLYYTITGLSYGSQAVTLKASYSSHSQTFSVFAQEDLGTISITDNETGVTYTDCSLELCGVYFKDGNEDVLTISQAGYYRIFTASLNDDRTLLLTPNEDLAANKNSITLSSFGVFAVTKDKSYYCMQLYKLPQTLTQIKSASSAKLTQGKMSALSMPSGPMRMLEGKDIK